MESNVLTSISKSGSDPIKSRILFAGSPEFAVPSLAALVDSPHDVVAVLTQPDRPAGRGRKLRMSPVRQYAAEHELDVLQPATLSDATIRRRLESLQLDLAVVVAYGLLLPPDVLEIPRAGCVNVHASLLPRWRGASPIQAAILAGDEETGVSIMQMDAGLDTGPVFASRALSIAPAETSGALEARLAVLGAGLLREVLDGIVDGSRQAVSQASDGATYAGRIAKADAAIDWNSSAAEIDRRIRAYHPWPVAETLLDGQRMRCWSAIPSGTPAEGATGQVVAVAVDGIDVRTGNGCLRLTEIQMPGGRRMPATQFANGYAVVGKTLGR